MSWRKFASLMVCGLFALSACAVEEVSSPRKELSSEQREAAPAPTPDEPPADAKVCNCTCGGVRVQVTIYPDRHGETCDSVNGRPCNTGAGWFKYTGC